MTTPDPESRLTQWIESIGASAPAHPTPAPPAGTDPILTELCWSYLVWDAGFSLAAGALTRLLDDVFDFNELRVCTADEIVGVLGPRYPKASERAERLLASLRAIFLWENGLTLARLLETGKREARSYLESLDGIPRFVSARVMLVALGGHALPIDERLAAHLAGASLIETSTSPDAAAAWLERRVRAGDAPRVYHWLEAAVERDSTSTRRAGTSVRRERTAAKSGVRRPAGER